MIKMMTTTMTMMVMMNHKKFLKKKKFNTKLQHLIWNTQKKLISNEERKSNTRLMNRNRKFFLLVFFVSFRFYTSQKVDEMWVNSNWIVDEKRVEQRKKMIGSQIKKKKKDTRIPPYVERERNTLGLFVDDNDDDGKYCGWFDGSVIIITVIMLLPFESNQIELPPIFWPAKSNRRRGKKKCFSFSKWKFDLVFVSLTHSFRLHGWNVCVCVVARVLRANKNKKLDTLVTHSFYQKKKN